MRFEEVETMREKMSDGQTSDWHCGGKRIPYLRQEPLCGEISGLRFASLEMTGRKRSRLSAYHEKKDGFDEQGKASDRGTSTACA